MGNRPETFATAFTCMDGRVQIPVSRFILGKTGAEHVDTITEPGMEKVLFNAMDRNDTPVLDSMRRKLEISTQVHGSKGVIVAGHEECAGNDIPTEEKMAEIVGAAGVLRSLALERMINVTVYAALVSRSPSGLWIANEIPLPENTF